jgi:rubrerythrin
VGNDRISATKDRQAYTKTTKLDVALRHVKKHFSPKTNDEHFDKAMSEVSENLQRLVGRANQDARGYYNSLQTTMAEYARKNWEHFTSNLNQEGKDTCAKYMEAHEKLETNEAIKKAYHNGEANTVLIKDGNYIIKNNSGISMHTPDILPQELKLKLGMLKLVAVGTVIEGMGYRATEDSYVIV